MISTSKDEFGVSGMQTNDTLFLADRAFAEKENKLLPFDAKPQETLSKHRPLKFNGSIIILENKGITLEQMNQGDQIQLVDSRSFTAKNEYTEQRAWGAYIASVCQPEAAFDLSNAAQNKEPSEEDIKALNKRLKWQMDNKDRGIHFIPLDLSSAKLFVFVDRSFANNKDLSFQIGYVVILANESATGRTTETFSTTQFKITGNVIHWSSVKCKRGTRSVLASELYGLVNGVNIATAITTTLSMITEQLGFKQIPLVVCTDSFSLY